MRKSATLTLVRAVWRKARFKPIPNWRQCLRFDTVQLAALLAFLSAVQANVLPLIQPIFSTSTWPWVAGGIALAIAVLRLRLQPELDAANAGPTSATGPGGTAP